VDEAVGVSGSDESGIFFVGSDGDSSRFRGSSDGKRVGFVSFLVSSVGSLGVDAGVAGGSSGSLVGTGIAGSSAMSGEPDSFGSSDSSVVSSVSFVKSNSVSVGFLFSKLLGKGSGSLGIVVCTQSGSLGSGSFIVGLGEEGGLGSGSKVDDVTLDEVGSGFLQDGGGFGSFGFHSEPSSNSKVSSPHEGHGRVYVNLALVFVHPPLLDAVEGRVEAGNCLAGGGLGRDADGNGGEGEGEFHELCSLYSKK